MASTTFIDHDASTPIVAAWLNDVDALTYDVFAAATTVALARTALGLGTSDSPTFAGLTLTGALTGTTGTFSGIVSVPDGTAAAPSIKIGDEQNGFYSSAAGVLNIACSGANAGQFSANTFIVSTANSGSHTLNQVTNSSDTASSYAAFIATVGGTSSGDPYTRYTVTGATSWAIGIDNSASDSFKIANNTLLGGNDYLTITTAGVTTLTSLVATTADINAGTIDATTIGATTPAAGTFTNITATGVISAPDGTAAAPSVKVGDEQNGLFSPAANTLGIAIGGSEVIRVDSGGRLMVSGGVAVQTFSGSVTPVIQALGVNSAFTGFGTARYSADAVGPIISIAKSRNASVGSHTVVQSGDTLAVLNFDGSDGTGFIRGAQLVGEVDGTPGTNDMPGRVRILTTADGASSSTEAFRLDNGQEAYFANIGTTASAANAFLNSGSSPANQLLRSTSSLSYKTDVEPIQKQYYDKILQLTPICYRSLAKADNPSWTFYGLGAEDVALVDPRLVTWGYKITSDKLEEVDVPIEEAYTETDFRFVQGAMQPVTVTKVRNIITKKIGRVVTRDDKLSPDGVMYDRISVLLLCKVKEQALELQNLSDRITLLENRKV